MSESEWNKLIHSVLKNDVDKKTGAQCPDISVYIGKPMSDIPETVREHLLLCPVCMIPYRQGVTTEASLDIPQPDWKRLDAKIRKTVIWEWLKSGLENRIRQIKDVLKFDSPALAPAQLRQISPVAMDEIEKIKPEEQMLENLQSIMDINLTGLAEPIPEVLRVHLEYLAEDESYRLKIKGFHPELKDHDVYFLSTPTVAFRILFDSQDKTEIAEKMEALSKTLKDEPTPELQSIFEELFEQSFVKSSTVQLPDDSSEDFGWTTITLNKREHAIVVRDVRLSFVVIG